MTLDVSLALSLAAACEEDDSKATPGPWEAHDDNGRATIEDEDGFAIAHPAYFANTHTIIHQGRENSIKDAQVIASSRNRLADVARVLRAAAAEHERIRSALISLLERWEAGDNSPVVQDILDEVSGIVFHVSEETVKPFRDALSPKEPDREA